MTPLFASEEEKYIGFPGHQVLLILGLSPGLSALDELVPQCHRPVSGLHLGCLPVSTQTDCVDEMPPDRLPLMAETRRQLWPTSPPTRAGPAM